MSWLNFFRRKKEDLASLVEPPTPEGEDRLNPDEIPEKVFGGVDFVSEFVEQSLSTNRIWTIEIFDPDLSMRISSGGDMMEIMADAPDLFSVFDSALDAMRIMEQTLKILNDQGNGLWIGRIRPIIISAV